MRSITKLAGAFLALAAISATALGDTPQATTPQATAVTLTTDDVNAWLDGYMPYALHTGDIAGAVVAVVKDGKIVTERGYGYSDVAKRTPVDPKLTLVQARVGIEAGHLDRRDADGRAGKNRSRR